MQTTLILDPDVVERLDRISRRNGKGLDATVNEILRAGLEQAEKSVAPAPFRTRSFVDGLRPGIDPDKISQLLDELATDGFARTRRA